MNVDDRPVESGSLTVEPGSRACTVAAIRPLRRVAKQTAPLPQLAPCGMAAKQWLRWNPLCALCWRVVAGSCEFL